MCKCRNQVITKFIQKTKVILRKLGYKKRLRFSVRHFNRNNYMQD